MTTDNDGYTFIGESLPKELRDQFLDSSSVFMPPGQRTCPACGGTAYRESDWSERDRRFVDWYECESCDWYGAA